MTTYAFVKDLPYQCGGKLLYNFSSMKANRSHKDLAHIKFWYKDKMLVATFNTQAHQKAYFENMCQTFTLLSKSEPIYNSNSGNLVFTAVFKA